MRRCYQKYNTFCSYVAKLIGLNIDPVDLCLGRMVLRKVILSLSQRLTDIGVEKAVSSYFKGRGLKIKLMK